MGRRGQGVQSGRSPRFREEGLPFMGKEHRKKSRLGGGGDDLMIHVTVYCIKI